MHKTSYTIFVSTSPLSVYMVFCANTFLRRTADVSFDEKRLKNVSQTSSKPILIEDVAVTKTYGSLGKFFVRGVAAKVMYYKHKLAHDINAVVTSFTAWCACSR